MTQLYDLLVLYRDKLIAKGAVISSYLTNLIISLNPSKVVFNTSNNITSCTIKQGIVFPMLDSDIMAYTNYTLEQDLFIPNILVSEIQNPNSYYNVNTENVDTLMYLKITGYGNDGVLDYSYLRANTSSPETTQLALATFKFDQNDNVYDINVLV